MQKLSQKCAEVVKLDKGFPLISVEDGTKIRAEFNNFLSKKHAAVAVGDRVRVSVPAEGDDPSIGIREQGLGELGIRDQGLGNSSDSQLAAPTNPYSLVPNPFNNPSKGKSPYIIQEILPRSTELLRNDPVNRRKPQVLAANFDHIAICVAANQLNFNHLARMLVISCNAGVPVTLIFTKCDLCEPNLSEVEELVGGGAVSDIVATSLLRHSEVSEFDLRTPSRHPERSEFELAKTSEVEGPHEMGSTNRKSNKPNNSGLVVGSSTPISRPPSNEVLRLRDTSHSFSVTPLRMTKGVCAPKTGSAQDDVASLFSGNTTILLGKSGVGKSTLINALAGKEVCKQGEVREFDSKGRHTTVSREIIETEHFGRIVDMPGVRSLGLINCQRGLETVFASIFDLAQNCKFRDCNHSGEPGCAVVGNVSDRLLSAFHELSAENAANSR